MFYLCIRSTSGSIICTENEGCLFIILFENRPEVQATLKVHDSIKPYVDAAISRKYRKIFEIINENKKTHGKFLG